MGVEGKAGFREERLSTGINKLANEDLGVELGGAETAETRRAEVRSDVMAGRWDEVPVQTEIETDLDPRIAPRARGNVGVEDELGGACAVIKALCRVEERAVNTLLRPVEFQLEHRGEKNPVVTPGIKVFGAQKFDCRELDEDCVHWPPDKFVHVRFAVEDGRGPGSDRHEILDPRGDNDAVPSDPVTEPRQNMAKKAVNCVNLVG